MENEGSLQRLQVPARSMQAMRPIPLSEDPA